ncbi:MULTISPECIES: hypothetical protein [Thiorhodovibrio]|uniref:Roadblock/LAMTOR2 domain-containing protein n=1 Tax=Thiorhodovibrio frisius TaxID=631362 RepID=H8YZE7_9GAMM|nr:MULTISPECIES: hypothetical protein [Thiorhodovibrio]EIC22074.1 hypothetical protein Thi970DRAFT_02320 [Thiorhodovibrio frisius]MBK5967353.1 hypothetical protein [Thiorhodovibrio winogradskyi]WPL24366.1 hypothetical protein Thiofri_04585 [Thiorhodovibrio frisius]
MSENENNKDRRIDRSAIPLIAVRKQLERIVKDGNLKAAVLASSDGLTLVAPVNDDQSEAISALAGYLNKAKSLIEKNLLNTAATDITFTGQDGTTFHCRYLELFDELVTLAVITKGAAPSGEILSRAMSGIMRIMRKHDQLSTRHG